MRSYIVHRVVAVSLVTLLAVPMANAYDLYYHESYTRRALSQEGFVSDSTLLVVNGNLYTDITVNTPGMGTPFLREVHFDDRFSFSMHKALRDKLDAAIQALSGIDCSTTDGVYLYATALGLVHHSLQDYYAHSNHTELVQYASQGVALGTTFNEVLTRPDMRTLKSIWLQDIAAHAQESLMSGAYFTSPPPVLDDSQGSETTLTHGNLMKDSYKTTGSYIYPDLDRQSIHFASGWNATNESREVLAKFLAANGPCYSKLVTYQFGFLERNANATAYRQAKFLGVVTGHWMSGDSRTIGDGLEVDNQLPTGYPDHHEPARASYGYYVKNTGDRPLKQLRLESDGILAVADPLAAPAGWRVERQGDAIVWIADAELKPGESVQLGFLPKQGGGPGMGSLITEAGRHVEVAAPVLPDLMSATLVRAAALMTGQDETALLDSINAPADVRRVPSFDSPGTDPPGRVPPSRRGCACDSGGSSGAPSAGWLALVGLVLLGVRRSRRSRRAG